MILRMPRKETEALYEALESGHWSNSELAQSIGISRYTLWRMLTKPGATHQAGTVKKIRDWRERKGR